MLQSYICIFSHTAPQNAAVVHFYIFSHSTSRCVCCHIGPVRIRHSSHDFGWQSSHSVDLAGWQAKMASIEIWIPWHNAHGPHSWLLILARFKITWLIYSKITWLISSTMLQIAISSSSLLSEELSSSQNFPAHIGRRSKPTNANNSWKFLKKMNVRKMCEGKCFHKISNQQRSACLALE